ncbi:hypothetical protein AAFC00_005784 [Neodothiora populina]|uniref:Apolipoprotein/apolipophorin n=1 Tax=Neodothiora populina TaxID=2781224 RepID=A0ABR3P5U5_9PEZI
MIPARPLARSALPRAIRSARAPRTQQARFQSSYSTGNASANSSHIGAGVAGGLAAAVALYGVYYITPAGQMSRKINKTAKEASQKYNEAAQMLQASTPNADQAIDSIKQFAYSYVGWIPGGRQYVDTAFKDFDTVRENHRDEADKLVNDAYRQFQDLAKSGLSMETASKAYDVLADLTKKVGELAGSAIDDILKNHPEAKEKFGGSVDQLKQMGEQYGPDAKKQVDETWKQVKEVMAGGFSVTTVTKAKKLIEEKVEQMKKLGDEAWSKGMEQAKPMLEKNPKIKDLIEKNTDALKSGNAKELFEKARSAVQNGEIRDFEEYINSTVEKAKSKGSQLTGGSLDQYFKMIPSGGEIIPKLKNLSEIAEKHKEEGEKLFKETMDELKQVLDKKSKKAQEIVEKAKKEAK